MKEKLLLIQKEALESINSPEANLEDIRIKYLGKKGELTSILRGMGALSRYLSASSIISWSPIRISCPS